MEKTTHTTLKPCPFCGGTNVKVFGPYGWYQHYGISHSCKTFYSGAQELAQGFHSEAAAVAAWNTRPAPEVTVGALQAIRPLLQRTVNDCCADLQEGNLADLTEDANAASAALAMLAELERSA